MNFDLSYYKDKRICVAVSGGVDSTSLLHFLKANEEKYGYQLCAVNFEHGIRGAESVADSQFVQELCAQWGVELYSFSEDCIARAEREKASLETSARNFRNEHYEQLLKLGKADVIATAHHADDVAETVLFRISRGSALSGATGIRRAENGRIRPFINKTKSEILAYATEHKIPYREDSTNLQTEATRNALRLQVLPILQARIPSAVKNISRFALSAAEDDSFLYELSNELLERKRDGYIVRFSKKKPIFSRACLTAMKSLGIDKDYTQTHLNDLFVLQTLKRGAMITLPKNVVAICENDYILFRYQRDEALKSFVSVPMQKGEFQLGEYEICISDESPKHAYSLNVLRLDYEKLPCGCVIRSRLEGDVFEKFGGGTKTLKRYMIDKKIPKENRDVPVIAKDNVVYAIFGTEISEKVKIDEQTKTTVYLTINFTGDKEL
ncbi:MAG: tRNA lysidine(34) synthetase TilS [Clostridia bacterium]|nr:tRNA lysidine(34) synthetase TilS [Clostridia bacterium]